MSWETMVEWGGSIPGQLSTLDTVGWNQLNSSPIVVQCTLMHSAYCIVAWPEEPDSRAGWSQGGFLHPIVQAGRSQGGFLHPIVQAGRGKLQQRKKKEKICGLLAS